MTLESKLKEISERAEKATAGPWILEGTGNLPDIEYYDSHCGLSTEPTDDEKFISASRQDVPMLLEMVEETINHMKDHGCFCDGEESGNITYECMGHSLQRELESIMEKHHGK